MKIEFNSDGSIKLPGQMQEKKDKDNSDFNNRSAIRITKSKVSASTPLRCELTITASDKVTNPKIISFLFNECSKNFTGGAELSIRQINEREYVVSIVSGYKRCTWCNLFLDYIRDETNFAFQVKGYC
ncbi:MAG: hypothetical protein ABIG89_05285 [Candidatus Woesearchaeota archaeon]